VVTVLKELTIYVFMVTDGHSRFLGTICDNTLRTKNYWVSGLSPSSGILNTSVLNTAFSSIKIPSHGKSPETR
jgi:hypothetical protein